jgi:hypothetical protein
MALTETMYLRFNNKAQADQQSKDLWTQILGHPADPADTTQMSFETVFCPNDNSGYIVLREPFYSWAFPKLTPQQQNFVTANMVPASNVQVQNCLAAQPKPPGP